MWADEQGLGSAAINRAEYSRSPKFGVRLRGNDLGGEANVDITALLRSLEMQRYAQTFRDNAIDLSVLPDLTDQDLEKLGVLLGHRRKLLRAIADFEAI